MLIDLVLQKKGEPRLIGAPVPTVKVWAKVDGVLSIMPLKDEPEQCELTLIGMPDVMVAMESPESLASRVNALYGSLGATGTFLKFGTKSGTGMESN